MSQLILRVWFSYYIYQAAMLDPHAGSELTIDEIRSLVDDLIQAHGDWLPEYH